MQWVFLPHTLPRFWSLFPDDTDDQGASSHLGGLPYYQQGWQRDFFVAFFHFILFLN